MSWEFNIKVSVNTSALDAVVARLGNQQSVMEMAKDDTVNAIKNNIKTQNIRDTDALLNSIDGAATEKGFVVQDGVSYGIFNEFGTYKMAARPFFVNALQKIGEFYAAHIKRLF